MIVELIKPPNIMKTPYLIHNYPSCLFENKLPFEREENDFYRFTDFTFNDADGNPVFRFRSYSGWGTGSNTHRANLTPKQAEYFTNNGIDMQSLSR